MDGKIVGLKTSKLFGLMARTFNLQYMKWFFGKLTVMKSLRKIKFMPTLISEEYLHEGKQHHLKYRVHSKAF